MTDPPTRRKPRPVHPAVDLLAAYSWRILAIGAVGVALFWLLGRLRIVVFPIIVALFLTRALIGPVMWLRRRGWRPLAATWAVLGSFLLLLVAATLVVVPATVDEFRSLGPTLERAFEDVEDWLVEDSPFDLTRREVDDLRDQAESRARRALRSSDDTVRRGVVLAGEVVAGIILAFILTLFAVKDGPRLQRWAVSLFAEQRRDEVRRVAAVGWDAIGGYLRGAASLGLLEAVIIGLAVWLAGGNLVVPVMVLTFFAAFVPLIGAIVAGAVAVLVTLATSGVTAAAVVLAVVIVVQQLDNDLLAPVIYGRAVQLHPAVILVAIAAGGALLGLPGTFLAVPVTAAAVNMAAELRTMRGLRRSDPGADLHGGTSEVPEA